MTPPGGRVTRSRSPGGGKAIDPALREVLENDAVRSMVAGAEGAGREGLAAGLPLKVEDPPIQEGRVTRRRSRDLNPNGGGGPSGPGSEDDEEAAAGAGRSGARRKRVNFAAFLDSPEEEEDEEEALPPTRRAMRSKRARRGVVVEEEDEEDGEDGEDGEDEDPMVRYPRRNRRSTEFYNPQEQESQEKEGMKTDDAEYEEEEEEEESEDDDIDDEEEEEDLAAHRYPRRSRRVQNYFNPYGGGEQPRPAGREKRRTRRQRQAAEELADLHADQELVNLHQRRSMRQRSEIQRYTPGANFSSPPRRSQSRRLVGRSGGDDGGRRSAARRRVDLFNEDDLIPDQNQAWWLLQGDPGAGPGISGPAGAPGHDGAIEVGGLAPPPWSAADGGPTGPDGQKKSKSYAEIAPIAVDTSISFDDIGGLGHYVQALKEMVFLPLVYPEVFERFHIAPPRGVLLHGPPGTGKTLCARALAATASRSGQKVTFFMRKGADILSKWVGEAERQLRMLFTEATKLQPSIIFFDEIDGLAPIRSGKQDQIHNSIVSTLLALMDGLDNRGQVVVIGATNRIDSLDSALRRPGRFDRELLFPLPNTEARGSILDIHTKQWKEALPKELRDELANECVGYCGADLKALCTEAALEALRRRYPQIYQREERLLIEPAEIKIAKCDFKAAQLRITPASHRGSVVHSRPVPEFLRPCLEPALGKLLAATRSVFPPAAAALQGAAPAPAAPSSQALAATFTCQARMLVCGEEGMGQGHLASAVLYALEQFPCHAIGLPELLADPASVSPEAALVNILAEARRASPAILYLPHLQLWWETAPISLQATLLSLLQDLPPAIPLFFLATSDCVAAELPEEALALFKANIKQVAAPSRDQRFHLFRPLFALAPMPPRALAAEGPAELEELPLAPREAAPAEAAPAKETGLEDEEAVRQLRMSMRNIVVRSLSDRRWRALAEAIDAEERATCLEAGVLDPVNVLTLLIRVDAKQYTALHQFTAAVDQLVATFDALCDEEQVDDARLLSRAHAFKDHIDTWIKTVPRELVVQCERVGRERADEQAKDGGGEPARSFRSSRLRGEDPTGGASPGGTSLPLSAIAQDPEQILRGIRAAKRAAREEAEKRAAAEAAEAARGKENVAGENAADEIEEIPDPSADKGAERPGTPPPEREPAEADLARSSELHGRLVDATDGLSCSALADVYAQLTALLREHEPEVERAAALTALGAFVGAVGARPAALDALPSVSII